MQGYSASVCARCGCEAEKSRRGAQWRACEACDCLPAQDTAGRVYPRPPWPRALTAAEPTYCVVTNRGRHTPPFLQEKLVRSQRLPAE